MDINRTIMSNKIQLMCILRVILALCLLKICQLQGGPTRCVAPGPHWGPCAALRAMPFRIGIHFQPTVQLGGGGGGGNSG